MAATIAISANTSWYLYNFRKSTISAIAREGYDVLAVSPSDDYSKRLEDCGCTHLNVQIDRGGKNPARDAKTILDYISIYSKYRPILTLNFTPKVNIYSSLAARALGIPTINNIAGLGTMASEGRISASIVKMLYKVSQRRAHHIFFQNHEDIAYFRNASIIDDMSSFSRLMGSGVDLVEFAPSAVREDGIIRFAMVARLLESKGAKIYAEAAKVVRESHPNTEFHLIGPLDEGNPGSISVHELDEWRIRNHIVYHGKTDNVASIVRNMDCVVLPSFYREGVPRSLLEAAALAKPIITTDNVGCRDVVVHGKNGYLCEPRNVTSLVERINQMISIGHEYRLAMGEASRELAEAQFDENNIISQYLAKISEHAAKRI